MWHPVVDIKLLQYLKIIMPKAGFEPARVSPPPPQDGVSANSTTSAIISVQVSARCPSPVRFLLIEQELFSRNSLYGHRNMPETNLST
jgi:hypothetical protein